MLITRECDYAVRVIRALSGAERLSVGEICEREEITAPFAYKILKKTSESKARQRLQRSPWRLFHEPDAGEITLFDIYTAIDPELMIIECMDPQYHCVRDNRDKTPCLVHRELVEIQKELWKLFFA